MEISREKVLKLAAQVWSTGGMYVGPSHYSLEQFAALIYQQGRNDGRLEGDDNLAAHKKEIAWLTSLLESSHVMRDELVGKLRAAEAEIAALKQESKA